MEALRDYYRPYVAIAREHALGLILDSPTWRANPDWGARLGYTLERLADVNRRAAALVRQVGENGAEASPILVSGCVGPRGDGYQVERLMDAGTVETDGRLPSRQPLGEAIQHVDAQTGAAAAYFMINCAHPTHFAEKLAGGGGWIERVRGVRANASEKSHAELDESDELDEGNPQALAESYRELALRLRSLTIFGGCCGTDQRHISAIAAECRA